MKKLWSKVRKLGIGLYVSLIRNKEKRRAVREVLLHGAVRGTRGGLFIPKEEFPAIFDRFQDWQYEQVKNEKFPECIQRELAKIKDAPEYLRVDSSHNYLNILLDTLEFYESKTFHGDEEVYLCWEIRRLPQSVQILLSAWQANKKVLFIGDSFLRSFTNFADRETLVELKKGISFTIDDITSYYDATRPSRLEQMLNHKNIVISEEQKQRARMCIDKIVKTNLTKFNNQPIFEPNIGRDDAKKILVVDQAYNDMSIAKGWANEKTFEEMLACAIEDNPDADIIVKTHPDTIFGKNRGYYMNLETHGNVYKMTEPINPISLIKYCDKVYVCTSQFGFEALMCGKEVHVFGMPFYAGWGLSRDRQKCERRTNTRTLEEVFYLTYIVYSHYVNPQTKHVCEIEEAMDYLLELREKGDRSVVRVP